MTAKSQTPRNAAGRLLDLKQAASYTGLNYWHVRELALAGHIPVVRLPSSKNPSGEMRRILIDRIDLDALIDRKEGLNIEPVSTGAKSA